MIEYIILVAVIAAGVMGIIITKKHVWVQRDSWQTKKSILGIYRQFRKG